MPTLQVYLEGWHQTFGNESPITAVILGVIVMSAKKPNPKSLSDAARRQLPDIAEEDRNRLIMASDFRKLEDQFRSSLKSAQKDHESFFSQFQVDTNLDTYEPHGIHNVVKQLCGPDGELKAVLADLPCAKQFYVLRVSVNHYGSVAIVQAIRKLAQAVRSDFLRLAIGKLEEFKTQIETFTATALRSKAPTYWHNAIVPILKSVEPTRFNAPDGDIWKPLQDSISACGLLADIIWPAETVEVSISEIQLKILAALLARKAFDDATRLATKLIAGN